MVGSPAVFLVASFLGISEAVNAVSLADDEFFAQAEVLDMLLDQAHLDAARRVLAEVVGGERIRLAFVSGSLAAGLGHGLSDVDLYVALRQEDGVLELHSYRSDGFIVQVNPLSQEDVDLIASTCSGYSDTAEHRPQTTLAEADLQRCARYAIGTVLVADAGLPSTEVSVLTIRRILMNANAYLVSHLAEDSLGAIRSGDPLTALQASQMAVESALECALAACGDVYVGRKFQLRRAARARALRGILRDLRGFLCQPNHAVSLAQTADLVARRQLFCSHLVSWSLLEGWEGPVVGFPAFADRQCDGGPLRSPWVTPVRFADSWGMAGPDTGFRTRAAMIRLWHALDGRPADEAYWALISSTNGQSLPRESFDAAVHQLAHAGVAMTGGHHLI